MASDMISKLLRPLYARKIRLFDRARYAVYDAQEILKMCVHGAMLVLQHGVGRRFEYWISNTGETTYRESTVKLL